MLAWGTMMEIGHAQFDRDHRQLIAMSNLLADALALNDAPQALRLLCDLETKADQHCRLEQEALERLHGDMEPVLSAHRRIADVATAIRLVLQAGETALARRLLDVLEESLVRAVAADPGAFTVVQARAEIG